MVETFSADQLKGQVSASDPQLEALLRVKAAVDTTGKLEEWRRVAGPGASYCTWRGVKCRMGKVYSISLWSNGMQGTLPCADAFHGLANLTRITIGDQRGISGTIPADWSRLQQLEDIRISRNSITGSIPTSWGNLTNMRVLYLYQNKLRGFIPASFRALTALENLELSMNALSGTIPDLSSLTKLRVLHLWENKLSGPIPTSFKALTALENLGLSFNGLNGTVPSALSRMRGLKRLHLSGNPQLGGCLPASLRQQLAGSYSDLAMMYDDTSISGFC